MRRQSGEEARRRLLAGADVEERQLSVAGVATAIVEGGEGPPMILLHGPGEYAARWVRVIPELLATHRVIAPDLPGHGASEVVAGSLSGASAIRWLDHLVEQTCEQPPVLVGHLLGGALAARFAASARSELAHLVLVDSLGLAPFEPAPEFGLALQTFITQPDEVTHDRLWSLCAADLDRLRADMGPQWEALKAYNLDRATAPGVRAAQHVLMAELGVPAIPPGQLAAIAAPTTLIWGREDKAVPVTVAEAVGARFGWPLHVIDGAADDPVVERPAAFVAALRAALEAPADAAPATAAAGAGR